MSSEELFEFEGAPPLEEAGKRAVDQMLQALGDLGTTVTCPKHHCGLNDSLFGIVIHLNDRHGWNREQIADWLEEQAKEHSLDLQFPVPRNL